MKRWREGVWEQNKGKEDTAVWREDHRQGKTGVWLGSFRRKRSESGSTNGRDTCRKSMWDLAFTALQRQHSSSGSVHSSNFEGSMDPGMCWERRLRQGTSQTWSLSPGASIPAEEVHPQQATVWWV